VENNFPVQGSGITLYKKIEKMNMFKANLRLEKLAYFVKKSVPNNKVKNMYGLL
jgi:hypothetical protein